MTLLFPNPSRSLDEKRNAVRFIGHDGMLELRFFVEAEALTRIVSGRSGLRHSLTSSLATN
jgi:hypothetical protein